jgi:preprotein translocase subunit SecG
MFNFFVLLIVLASVLMCLIVLIQNSKGGGLASGFASSNQIMGVRKTTDFLEKATWTLAIAMVVLSIVSAGFVEKETEVTETFEINNTAQPSVPVATETAAQTTAE